LGYLGVGEVPDSIGHNPARVVATLPFLPAMQLVDRIAGRLARDRRIAETDAQTVRPVTRGATGHAPRGVAGQIERRRRTDWTPRLRRGHVSVELRYRPAVAVIQPPRHFPHHHILPDVPGVVLHLLLQIACVQTGQSRHADSVTGAVQTVAAEAGVGRTALPATHGDDLTRLRERRPRLVRRRRAGRKRQQQKQGQDTHIQPTPPARHGSAFGGTLTMGAGLIGKGKGVR
jgi:hypothetical protein